MKFAQRVFLIAGIYGLIVTVPLAFLERQIAVGEPPAITHPEYFYAFIGVTTVWQILFIVISRDPVRYRPLMLIGALEKSSMLVTFLILAPEGRFPVSWSVFGAADILLGVLFLVAYARTRP